MRATAPAVSGDGLKYVPVYMARGGAYFFLAVFSSCFSFIALARIVGNVYHMPCGGSRVRSHDLIPML